MFRHGIVVGKARKRCAIVLLLYHLNDPVKAFPTRTMLGFPTLTTRNPVHLARLPSATGNLLLPAPPNIAARASQDLMAVNLDFLDAFSSKAIPQQPPIGFPFPFWGHLQELAMRLWEPLKAMENHSFLAAVLANIFPLTSWLQRLGENTFVALLFVALIQGGLAIFQYRNDARGELMVPMGLTIGEEMPKPKRTNKNHSTTTLSSSLSNTASTLRSGALTDNSTVDGEANILTKPYFANMTVSKPANDSRPNKSKAQTPMLQRINRLLIILIPWLAGQANFFMQRNAHLLHIGSILTLTSIFEIPQSFLLNRGQPNLPPPTSSVISNTKALPQQQSFSLSRGKDEHVIVIGDSLAVGLGTVDEYDKNKTRDMPFMRIENIGDPQKTIVNKPGPAFPQALARTLANQLKKRVTWRSAGVDGGDIQLIRYYCLDLIKEEVDKGRAPDVVVILCGANDMKYFLSNPFQRSKWPKSFRSKLISFLEEIRALAPSTTILLPAIPSQMFHKNSPLNVFPLGFLLDTMVGFWDSQKRLVANSFHSKGVLYMGLSAKEISSWYEQSSNNNNKLEVLDGDILANLLELDEDSLPSSDTTTLIAKDGVHPNARCYKYWAHAIGKQLVAAMPFPRERNLRRKVKSRA